jgi:sugar phosphate isomerase/epimerase
MPISNAPVAVCSWSLQAASPAELVARVQATGARAVQLALTPIVEKPAVWRDTFAQLAAAGIEVASGMLETVGEDYSTLDTIKVTGGVVPDSTWDENWRNFQANARIAVDLGLKLVTLHAGFLPHEESDPSFAKLMDRIARTADLFAGLGLDKMALATATGVDLRFDDPQRAIQLACSGFGIFGACDKAPV